MEIDSVVFAGFSRSDSCGRSNIAIANSHAGIGKGYYNNANSGNYGFAICTPVFMRRLTWHKVALKARFTFSRGLTAPGTSHDYGFSECIYYDEDGSLSLHMTDDGDTTPELLDSVEDLLQTRLLMADAQRRWTRVYQEDCRWTLENPNWFDTGDNLNAVNRCPPWLRREPEMLSAAVDLPDPWLDSPDWEGFVWRDENEIKWPAISIDSPVSRRHQMNRQGVITQVPHRASCAAHVLPYPRVSESVRPRSARRWPTRV